jgi:sucrose-6-phosphate hydrolase SacC (GH32 family)
MNRKASTVILICLFIVNPFGAGTANAQKCRQGRVADKPLYRDPVYDGAADPVIIWNKTEKKWFMFYTNRRAKAEGLDGVTWVHGTRIGIAESSDSGATWKYRDTCDIQYRNTGYTHWAPEVIEHNGIYHMYLTFVPGIFSDWRHPRHIIHLTSQNLINWKYESTLELASERCIDACVFRMPDGSWRMYYNNEADRKSIYYADSPDLFVWKDSGEKVVGDRGGEGPKVFQWKGKYRMLVDNWRGLGVYSSDDLVNWKRQENNILEEPGKGRDDKVIGGHPDVVVNEDRAFVFYFTHPGRTIENSGQDNYDTRRSSIQVAELELVNGQITCDRDKPVYIRLEPQK